MATAIEGLFEKNVPVPGTKVNSDLLGGILAANQTKNENISKVAEKIPESPKDNNIQRPGVDETIALELGPGEDINLDAAKSEITSVDQSGGEIRIFFADGGTLILKVLPGDSGETLPLTLALSDGSFQLKDLPKPRVDTPEPAPRNDSPGITPILAPEVESSIDPIIDTAPTLEPNIISKPFIPTGGANYQRSFPSQSSPQPTFFIKNQPPSILDVSSSTPDGR
jgi:hypothetical protein